MPRLKASAAPAPPLELELPLPAEGTIGSLAYWQNEIDRSHRRMMKEIDAWKRNLARAYRSSKDAKYLGLTASETFVVPTDFYYAEQKRGQLFFQTPEILATGEFPEAESAAPLIQHVLNGLLGPKEADALSAVHEAIIDVLVPSGIGPVEIGYEAEEVDVPMPTGRTQLDPLTGQPTPVLDPATGEPETVLVPQKIWERYFFERFSPAKLLIPCGFLSTQFDKGPWIGRFFDADADQVRDTFSMGRRADVYGEYRDDLSLAHPNDKEFLRSTARGVVIYYRARVYDRTAFPDQIRRLVLVGASKKDYQAVVHEPLKYQQFDLHGKLIAGMRGYPIDPLTIRTVSDQAYPPSDCTIARPLADELSMSRSQMVKQRARNVPMRAVDTTTVDAAVVKQMERGDYQAIIKFNGPVRDEAFRTLPQAPMPPENFGFVRVNQADLEKTWGLGANQLGGSTEGTTSATESTIVEQAKDVRIGQDRNKVLAWYARVVEKFSWLPRLFGTDTKYVEIAGPQGGTKLQAWDRSQIQGRFAFTFRPDSSQRVNATEQRAQFLQFYNLTANSPYINQPENAKEVLRAFGKDPARMSAPPPPPPPPDKPKITMSIKGDDLNPLAPQYANVLLVLRGGDLDQLQPPAAALGGPSPSPPAPALASGPPSGVQTAAQPIPAINKHGEDLTGRLPGPRLAAGGVQ